MEGCGLIVDLAGNATDGESEVVDLFCGGGGTTAGMEAAGLPVTVAVNHWDTAIRVHQANHPRTRHHHCDIWNVAPVEATGGRPVAGLWASPDCTHHSVARGGKPRQQKLRTLPWAVVRWAAAVRPEVMFVENVPEFRKWGPLGKDKKPIKPRQGETFRAWCRKLERLGYVVAHRVLCAADYGVPTSRKRLIIVARRDGLPICWPEPTHGSKKSCALNPRLQPFRTAAECIDWSLPCPSIFERKRPLAEKTMDRVAEGIRRFVLEAAEPFVIRTDMHKSNASCVYSADDPLTTVTSSRGHAVVVPTIVGVGGRAGQSQPATPAGPLGTVTGKNDRALVAPILTRYNTDERGRAQSLTEPITTIDGSNRFGLVAPHLVKVNHGGAGRREARGEQIDLPLSTVTAGRRGHALVAPVLVGVGGPAGQGAPARVDAPVGAVLGENHRAVAVANLLTIDQQSTENTATSPEAPLGTVTTKNRHAMVAAFLAKHYGGVVGVPFDGRPLDTITAKDHHGLAAATLVKFRGTAGQPSAQDVRGPVPTITASGNHVAEVRAFLTAYYSEDGTSGQSLLEPMRTITARHRLGLVTIHDVDYQIVDIGLRMLEPEELERATCGPEFHLDLSEARTKEAKVKLVGNAVPPGLAAAVVRVNLPASMRRKAPLRAPFPYFGGKRRVASTIWQAFGADVTNYVEPFFGTGAVLLARPWSHGQKYVETVNDRDAYLTNFWRAVQAAPDEVARWADWPVNELDLHARHRWLVGRKDFVKRLRRSPTFYDAKIAGWWVWGISQWIGSGWCCEPTWEGRANAGRAARGVNAARRMQDLRGNPEYERRPSLSCANGVHTARGTATSEHEQGGGRGVGRTTLSEQMPDLSGDSGATGRGTHAGSVRGTATAAVLGRPHLLRSKGVCAPTAGLYAWLEALAARLRWVRICCGDFARILTPSVTEKIGTTAVFLDPPYDPAAGRDPSTYAEEDASASPRARAWALEHGEDPKYRIALCGYEGEHEMPASWQCPVHWKAAGGYASSAGHTENASRERIWLSPHCNRVDSPHPQQGQLFREEPAHG